MKSIRNVTSALLVMVALLSASASALGQERIKTSAKSGGTAVALFALEDVRPGMKGVARSVFAGSEPQEFGLEILGLLPGFTGPRQSTIIAKLSGPGVDRTGVF